MLHNQNEKTDKASRDLKRRVINFLWQRHIASLRKMSVEANNGTVVLRGKVRSFYEKQLCLNCCQHVAGVVNVVDQVEVEWPVGQTQTLALT